MFVFNHIVNAHMLVQLVVTDVFCLHLGADLVGFLRSYPDLEVTALVRNPAYIEAVRAMGVKVAHSN
jgi:hypothetical protein